MRENQEFFKRLRDNKVPGMQGIVFPTEPPPKSKLLIKIHKAIDSEFGQDKKVIKIMEIILKDVGKFEAEIRQDQKEKCAEKIISCANKEGSDLEFIDDDELRGIIMEADQ